jgi:hypothetical protein
MDTSSIDLSGEYGERQAAFAVRISRSRQARANRDAEWRLA